MPIIRQCRPACRSGYSCVLGQCTRNQTPQPPPNNGGGCTGNDTCQNGYCLPNICAPCPYDQGVVCIWHMPCPDGFDCRNGKCYKNCFGNACGAKTCTAATF